MHKHSSIIGTAVIYASSALLGNSTWSILLADIVTVFSMHALQ
jgi:hypothetical protein